MKIPFSLGLKFKRRCLEVWKESFTTAARLRYGTEKVWLRGWQFTIGALLLISLALLGLTITRHSWEMTPAKKAENPIDARVQSQPRTPISFELNQGQVDSTVKFMSRGQGYGLFLTSKEAVFAMRRSESRPAARVKDPLERARAQRTMAPPAVLKMQVVGADDQAPVNGVDPMSSRSNYFIGNDPEQWRADVPHFAKVKYENIYPGVNLIYHSDHRQLEYDFVVAPGADAGQIKLAFEGAEQVRIDESGDLVLTTGAGVLRQHKPVIYQEVSGVKQEVSGHYVMRGGQEVGFELGAYDRTRTLVIDPVLVYATYLGGFDDDVGNAVEADAQGNTYVTGTTFSIDFVLSNPLQGNLRGVGNAFVTKLNASGQLVFSTYLGGSTFDSANAIAIDAARNVYVAGNTQSSDFPVTLGAAQFLPAGLFDGFVAKLNPTGSAVLYSTYLGGANDESINAIAVDSSNSVYLAGLTSSVDFPVRAPFQAALRGPTDAFVAKLNADATAWVYASYFGGSGNDNVYGIAVDGSGSAHLAGITQSLDLPMVNAAQSSLGGGLEAFITKFAAQGNSLVYSSYIGGNLDDVAYSVSLDGGGNAYVGGFTGSPNFPVKNAFQANSAGGDDAFLAKYSPAGAQVYATYFGGAANDQAFDLAATTSGDVYVVGSTGSTNFPIVNPIQAALKVNPINLEASTPNGNRLNLIKSGAQRQMHDGWPSTKVIAQTGDTLIDAFITKFGQSGAPIYSTFLGGGGEEGGLSIATDNQGRAYVTGYTAAPNFPTKMALQRVRRGVVDAFVAKIADSAITQTTVSAASFQSAGGIAPDQIVAAFGEEFTLDTIVVENQPLPFNVGGITVDVTDGLGVTRPAQIFFVSQTQVNFLMPSGLAAGAGRIQVLKNGVVVSTEDVLIAGVSPGLFAKNANGQGVAAALVLRIRANGTQFYEEAFELSGAAQQFVTKPIDLSNPNEQAFLILYGTGLRSRSSLTNVTATMTGQGFQTPLQVLYAGPQGTDFAGLDQVNLVLPRSLAGRGAVQVSLVVDGRPTNSVSLNIR
ncbi:MAG TPA: SBBP repeat-containing protein [Blastocatellia bacterium]|nr:SBBP repeat-containing protein [Blastocatellia bacterium]